MTGQLFLQLVLGCAVTLAALVLQAGFVGGVIAAVDRFGGWLNRPPRPVRAAMAVAAVAFWLTLSHGLAIWLWTALFYRLGLFADVETALYFAAVAFTTLGFGDITLPEPWRQLAGFCAANGLLAFGVSAALLMEALRRIWGPR